MKTDKRPIGVDLFCGVGGMSLGFEQAGFNVVAAVDLEPIHVEMHHRNFPNTKTLRANISELTGKSLREQSGLGDTHIDVLFGGSPCQGFSTIGKRQADDPRNALLSDFARLIKELQPSYFVVENVKGLLLGEAIGVLDAFVSSVGTDYSVVTPVTFLDASDFGVPQRRERVFIMGYKTGLSAPNYPTPITKDGKGPTVWDAIKDLPNIDTYEELLTQDIYRGKLGSASEYAQVLRGERVDSTSKIQNPPVNGEGLGGCLRTVHTPNTVVRFASVEPGRYDSVSHFYRLTKDGLAPTLRAGTDQSHGSYMAPRPIHPVHPRCITVREAARLHSFPDWFQFHPTKWHGFRQVGNSVPPLLARGVANQVLQVIKHQDQSLEKHVSDS